LKHYLITILDDHSRTVIASGLYERQTVSEVVEVLKAAVLTYGIPQRLVCDRGSQFTCSEFRHVCAVIQSLGSDSSKLASAFSGVLLSRA
jgi:hypothetical protein